MKAKKQIALLLGLILMMISCAANAEGAVVDADRLNLRLEPATSGLVVGILKEGAAADVIVMDYKPFTPFSDANIDGHMLFGMNGRNCRTTVINGRLLYHDRKFVDLDEESINAWTLEQSKLLWGELNQKEY